METLNTEGEGVWVFCLCACLPHVYSACGSQKRASKILGLELQMVMDQ